MRACDAEELCLERIAAVLYVEDEGLAETKGAL